MATPKGTVNDFADRIAHSIVDTRWNTLQHQAGLARNTITKQPSEVQTHLQRQADEILAREQTAPPQPHPEMSVDTRRRLLLHEYMRLVIADELNHTNNIQSATQLAQWLGNQFGTRLAPPQPNPGLETYRPSAHQHGLGNTNPRQPAQIVLETGAPQQIGPGIDVETVGSSSELRTRPAPTVAQREILTQRGLEAVDTVPNGDCLFEAVLVSRPDYQPLQPAELRRRVSDLRQRAADYLAANETRLQGFHGNPNQSYEDAVRALGKRGVYMNDSADLVPYALAHMLGLRLTVVDENGRDAATYGPENGVQVTLLRTLDAGGHYLGVRAMSTAAERPDVQMAEAAPAEPPRIHPRPTRSQPRVRRVELDQGRTATETVYPPEPPGTENEVQILWTRTIQHQLTIRPEMDHAFPWRDPRDPVHRVYAPYADDNGQLHPAVRNRVDHITATITIGQSQLERIARNPDDPRLPLQVDNQPTDAYLKNVVWGQLEKAVATEIKRLVRGSTRTRSSAPLPVTPGPLRQQHLLDHERALLNKNGLFLTEDAVLTRDGKKRRPAREWSSLLNGRILGVYLGAVLDTEDTIAAWGQTYASFPDYRMDVTGTTKRPTTMSAEGAANAIAFANVALEANTSRPAYDRSRINAYFVNFAVRMPDRDGGYRNQPIAVLVALDNAFDDQSNPHRLILTDYGPDYLSYFDKNKKKVIKREPEE
ncbi:OTU domain-containing protein [Kibdelosporangium philippinense]